MALMWSNAVVVGDEDLFLAEGCVEPICAADAVGVRFCDDALALALEIAISASAFATAARSRGGAFAFALAPLFGTEEGAEEVGGGGGFTICAAPALVFLLTLL